MYQNYDNYRDFLGKNSNKGQQISKLKKEIEERDKKINSITNEKEQYKADAEKLKSENEELKNNLKNIQINYQSEKSQYQVSIKELKNIISELKKNKKLENEKEIKNLLEKIENLQNENQINKNKLEKILENADKSSKYENRNKEDFYDLIIKCNSIMGLKSGWEVVMTEKGKKKYDEHKNTKYTKIGVIGSENRGKSTILSDFSKIELPTGVSIKTEGLSIKYPELEEFKNRKFILLDSAGLETPILKADNIAFIPEEQEEKNANKPIGTIEKNEDIKNGDKKENVHDLFENKSRDIIQLELFLQNFIIKYSDILILILGKLTINEQKLLLKVNSHIKNLNRKEALIVIHNLKEFETRKQVEDYLNEILKKSSTFSLEENFDINLENEESGWKPLFEPKSDPKIYHLIYAKKGTEAGDYYNDKAIKYIYQLISLITDKESFDPIECIKNYFSEISETILENPIGKAELMYNEDLIDKNDEKDCKNKITKIMLKEQKKEIILKKCLIDELGIVQGNSFNAQYSYYITDKNVFVYVELPGKCPSSDKDIEYEDVEIDTQPEGSYYIIKITGRKKNCFDKIIGTESASQFNKRQFGEFNIQIKLDKINLIEDYEKAIIENGCLLITYEIRKRKAPKKI